MKKNVQLFSKAGGDIISGRRPGYVFTEVMNRLLKQIGKKMADYCVQF